MCTATWGSATQQRVMVRAVLRVSFDGYGARRRWRDINTVNVGDAAGQTSILVLAPLLHETPDAAGGPPMYTVVLLLAGLAVYIHRHVAMRLLRYDFLINPPCGLYCKLNLSL